MGQLMYKVGDFVEVVDVPGVSIRETIGHRGTITELTSVIWVRIVDMKSDRADGLYIYVEAELKPVDSLGICTCDSFLLTWNGCKCGQWAREKKAKNDSQRTS